MQTGMYTCIVCMCVHMCIHVCVCVCVCAYTCACLPILAAVGETGLGEESVSSVAKPGVLSPGSVSVTAVYLPGSLKVMWQVMFCPVSSGIVFFISFSPNVLF